MKWLVLIGCLATLTRCSQGNVLKCLPGSQESSCIIEKEEERVQKKSDLPSGKECAEGTTWKTECNTCYCQADGRSVCTKIGCRNEHPMRCKPGSRWMNDCNSCYCTTDGLPLCTKIGCVTINDFLDPVFFEESEQSTDKKTTPEMQDNVIEKEHKLTKRASLCKPNQEFQSECNSCKCAADGLTYSCTQNECLERDMNKEVEVFMESEGVDHIERHSVCKPRDTFYISCNTCHCNLDGTNYTCTNKLCPLPEDVELFHELKIATSSKNKTVICEANRSFMKECNTCWCNEDGTSFYCTRKACVPELPDEIEEEKPEDLRIIIRQCRPNEVFEMDCNMCRCNPDGKSFSCTRRACVDQIEDFKHNLTESLRKVRALTQEPKLKACKPGSEFRMDCNTCLCDDEGQDFSCTRIDCNAVNNNNNGGLRVKRETTEKVSADCTPGSVFERGCNVCRCTEVGSALCTTNKCKDHSDKENTDKPSTELQNPEFDANFRCNPGEQYSFDCNDCTCSADGKSIFCTIRFCDQH